MKCYNFNPEKLRIRATKDSSVSITVRSIFLEPTRTPCLWYVKSEVSSFFASKLTSVTVDPVVGVTNGVTFTGEGCFLMLIGWLEGAKPFLEGLVSYSDKLEYFPTGYKGVHYSVEYGIRKGTKNSTSDFTPEPSGHQKLSDSFMEKHTDTADWSCVSKYQKPSIYGWIPVDPAKLAAIHCNCNDDPDTVENYVGDFSAT